MLSQLPAFDLLPLAQAARHCVLLRGAGACSPA